MKHTLDEILGTIGIELAHDGIEFRLVPFTNTEVIEWNRAVFGAGPDGESQHERIERVQLAQLELISKKMRACVVGDGQRKVTAKWVGEQFPQTILQDFASYFANGDRPQWAGESGN